MGQLPHLDAGGHARMVDVGDKPATVRRATAQATVHLSPDTAEAVFEGELPKGDAVAVARIAAIQAAKKTSDLIPLCHPLPLTSVEVIIERIEDGALITSHVGTTAPTGVEMEAMTAVTVAALTLYDMVKGIERGVEVGAIRLMEKSGGRSGTWSR